MATTRAILNRRRRQLLSLALMLVCGRGVLFVLERTGRHPSLTNALITVGGVLAVMFLGMAWTTLRCPVCDGRFNLYRALLGLLKRLHRCPYCGLNLDAELPER